MSDKCKFCGAKKEVTKCGVEFYDCDTYYGITSGEWSRGHECQSHQIAALQAEVKRLKDEDDTPPIDERLAAAGKIFRELIAEREKLRREVERLRAELAEAKQ